MSAEPILVRDLIPIARSQPPAALEDAVGKYVLASPPLGEAAEAWAHETRMAVPGSTVVDGNFSDFQVHPLKGRLRLLRRVVSVGRAPYNDVVLPDESISKVHAKFELQAQRVYLVDAGSSQGTLINGRALGPGEKQFLQHNDTVTFGAVSMKFYQTARLHPLLARMVELPAISLE